MNHFSSFRIIVVIVFFTSSVFQNSINDYRRLSKQYKKISKVFQRELAFELDKKTFESLFQKGLNSSLKMLNKYIEEQKLNDGTLQTLFIKIYAEFLEGKFNDSDHRPNFNEYRRDTKESIKTLKFFSGKWYGKWREMSVNHLWLSPVKLNKEISINSKVFYLKAYQSVFIGDGIGWNYILENEGISYVLGMTYHYKKGKITMSRPHIGFTQNKNTIIWQTKDHVYFEYICRCKKIGRKKHYLIDGVYLKHEAFRAIYSRKRKRITDFQRVKLKSDINI